MRNTGLDEAQAGIKISGRNINSLRYADDTILQAESEEKLKSLLMKVKEKSGKAGLKLSIQKTKIMASCPITSWQIMGKQWKQWEILFLKAPKWLQMVTAAMKLKAACSLEKEKAMTNLVNMLKSGNITLPTKVCLVKAMQNAMAPHSNTLAWKVPWTKEPGRLQTMGSRRVGHDWATSL